MNPVLTITHQYDGEDEQGAGINHFFPVNALKEQLQTVLQNVSSSVARTGTKCTVRVYLYTPEQLDEYRVTRNGAKGSPVWLDNRTNQQPYTCTYCGKEVQAPLSYHEGAEDCKLPSQVWVYR
jgi:hypothetical protein